MDSIGVAAASGMRARMESLDMLSNNLANASTSGFKADRELYGLYAAPEATGDPALRSPVINRNWTDFSQGPLQATAKATDLALTGPGFFAVDGPNGPLYTRSGSFRLTAQGVLTTADGYAVQNAQGQPIRLQPDGAFTITANGEVHQNGGQIGQLRLVEFDQPTQLVKTGSNFTAPDGVDPAPARSTQVQQGYLEGANVQVAESAVRMIHVLRQFESLQKAMTLAGEMNRQAIGEVARVRS